jgi:DNA-binding NtrC family response regulator
LEHSAVDILLTDLKLPRTNGVELLKLVHDLHPEVAVVVLTQYGSIESAVQTTRLGAMDYVTKPFHIEELRSRLECVARAVELQQENRLLREQLRSRPGFGGLIVLSPKIERVYKYKIMEKVSQHEYPVLILGESGTGKELVARCIHYTGPRKDRAKLLAASRERAESQAAEVNLALEAEEKSRAARIQNAEQALVRRILETRPDSSCKSVAARACARGRGRAHRGPVNRRCARRRRHAGRGAA